MTGLACQCQQSDSRETLWKNCFKMLSKRHEKMLILCIKAINEVRFMMIGFLPGGPLWTTAQGKGKQAGPVS